MALLKLSHSLIAISAFTLLNAGAQAPVTEKAKVKEEVANDIKPPLTKEGFDKEEMRLARVIHKRIVDYQGIKAKTNNYIKQPFAAYQDTTKTGAKFQMLPVSGGSFTWKGEQAEDSLEVTLSPFWMGKTEVTWEEYEPFVHTNIAREKNGKVPDFIRDKIKHDIDLLARPTAPYMPLSFGMKRVGHPAIGMTQHAANKYCQWLSFQTGHFYRLPTEAEWEYACRADSKTIFSWGNDEVMAKKHAWFGGNLKSHYHKPAQKKPNAWGFYDMHGNILEWTLDQYVPNRKNYFNKKKVQNPWVKATKPYPHVTKGGHWQQPLKDITAARRHQATSEWKRTDCQNPKSLWYHTDAPWLGFRIVRPVKIPTAEEMYHYWNSGVAED